MLLPSERMEPAEVWRLVEKHRVTNLFTVPTIVKLLVEKVIVSPNDLEVRLRANGASPAVELPVRRRQARELRDRLIRDPMRSFRPGGGID